jgi:hypothetical protein
VRFESKNVFFYFEKPSSLKQRWRCPFVIVKSEVMGLATDLCRLNNGQTIQYCIAMECKKTAPSNAFLFSNLNNQSPNVCNSTNIGVNSQPCGPLSVPILK